MKRWIAAVLSALTVCNICAFAADQADPTDEAETGPVKLSFQTLEDTVRKNNVTIKANDNTVKNVEETDVTDDYFMQYVKLADQIAALEKEIKRLDAAMKEFSDQSDPGYRALKVQRDSLKKSLASLQDSYNDLDDDEDDAKDEHKFTVDGTRRQMQNAGDLICMSAENTYISLQMLAYSQNDIERSIAQLDRQITAGKISVQRGSMSQNALKSLQSQREGLLASRNSLRTQYDNLSNTLAIQCGYPTGTALETEALPAVTQQELDAVQYDADLAAALANSYSIWSKEDAVRQASDAYERGDTYNLYAYDAAKIALDAEKENVTASFRKLHKALEEAETKRTAAQADLELAQKNYTLKSTQYSRGMISRTAYSDAQDAFAAAQEAYGSAQTALLTAYNNYQWAKRGVMSAAA
ncbi:MAG: TolC family protein [Eubacteriales bacterium]|nr:TolC family protein [Eubacteriales bacterium]